MPLDNLLCGLLETGINKLQQLDTSAPQKRKALNGIIIGVTLKELNKPLYFVISKQQIDILSQYDGQADCFIRLNLSALQALHNSHQVTHLIKTEQLDVSGDIRLAQQFAQLITEMNIDWEELLSATTGDLLAHKFCYHLKQSRQHFVSQRQKIQRHSALLITEELKIAPGALQVAYFCEQVSELEKRCLQLEMRIVQRFNHI